MTTHRHAGASPGTPAQHGEATSRANRWTRKRRAQLARARPLGMHGHTSSRPESLDAGLAPGDLEDLWDRHGSSVYALACTLLCDEVAATQAVALGMTDLARSTKTLSVKDAKRSMARHVYWRSLDLAGATSRTQDLPPTMVWLGQLAQLQRTCLALCIFGGHTHREAATLLGVPPLTVAESLTSSLRELGLKAAAGAPPRD